MSSSSRRQGDARDSLDRPGESEPLLGHDTEQQGESQDWRSFVQRVVAPLKDIKSLRPLERVLLGLSLVLLLLFAVFVGLYAGAQSRLAHGGGSTDHGRHGGDDHRNSGSDVCTSPKCVMAASDLLRSIDATVSPCDDFYAFSTGNWLAEHPIPGDAGLFGMAQQIGVDNAKLMRKYLVDDEDDKAPAMHGDDKVNLNKLRAFYGSCMDTHTQDKLGATPMTDLMDELYRHLHGKQKRGLSNAPEYLATLAGRLDMSEEEEESFDAEYIQELKPIPPNRPPSRHPPTEPPSPLPPNGERQKSMTDALAWLHSQGIPALFSWSVDGDPVKDPTFGTAYLSPDGLGFPDKAYYEDKEDYEFYARSIQDAFDGLDAALFRGGMSSDAKDGDKKWSAKLARAVANFEAELAGITPDGEDLEDPIGTYNPATLTSLSYKFSLLDWPTYLSALTHKIPKAIIVRSPSYVSRLDALISRTKTEVLEAYLMWTLFRSRGLQLGPRVELRRPLDALERRAKGTDPDAREDRDTICFAATNAAIGNLAGHFYVQDAFSERARSAAAEIIDSIIDAFKRRLPELAWLDPKTRQKAQEKADAIRIKVGWPLSPNTTDASAMAQYYSDLKISSKDYFGNYARALQRQSRREWSFVNRKLDEKRWDMIPSEVNAYYNPGGNEIVFPAGILQPQYFSEYWPAYLQYGAFGNVAGHELSHAFDPAGRLYDEQGRLRDWWTNDTATAFNERRDCIIDQYGNYTIPDGKGGQQHLRSRFTIGEDVADAGGLAQSYRAWHDAYLSGERQVVEANLLLPGLEYTREQLFFIAYGIGWARNIRTQEAIRRLRTDEHSPTKYRVIGALSNNRDFARAFGCTPGKDKMARSAEERCEIW